MLTQLASQFLGLPQMRDWAAKAGMNLADLPSDLGRFNDAATRHGALKSPNKAKRLSDAIRVRTAALAEAVTKESHLAPGRVAGITGLAEGGMAAGLRKMLTWFGSGWQGDIPPNMGAKMESIRRLLERPGTAGEGSSAKSALDRLEAKYGVGYGAPGMPGGPTVRSGSSMWDDLRRKGGYGSAPPTGSGAYGSAGSSKSYYGGAPTKENEWGGWNNPPDAETVARRARYGAAKSAAQAKGTPGWEDNWQKDYEAEYAKTNEPSSWEKEWEKGRANREAGYKSTWKADYDKQTAEREAQYAAEDAERDARWAAEDARWAESRAHYSKYRTGANAPKAAGAAPKAAGAGGMPPSGPPKGFKFKLDDFPGGGKGLAITALIVAAAGIAAHHAHSKRKDRQTQIEGLRHRGVAGRSRRDNTDFGSGWQGIDDDPHKRRRRDQLRDMGLTPGQAFDVADTGMEVQRLWGGGGQHPFGAGFATFAGLDVAMSSASAKPEEMGGKLVGALAAQASGAAAWGIGATAGLAAGTAVGAFVGGALGGALTGGLGVGVGATVGGFIGEWGTKMIVPFLIDPYVRRIARPINRIIGEAQRKAHFGKGFQDSQQAFTMRQQSEQELKGSLLNAFQYIGREAQLMHQ